MENEEAELSALRRPQVVGNAFVEQYYTALSQAPELVHKFYHDTSVISRPGSDNLLSSASTLDDIEKLILSQDYKNCVIEILTVDAQVSVQGGVLVLVTGFFTGKENSRRKFTQIFFLAPQEDLAPQTDAFFVLNDVFRYMDEETTNFEYTEADSTAVTATVSPDSANNAGIPWEEDTSPAEESSHPLGNGNIPSEEEVAATNALGTKQDDAHAVSVDFTQNDADPVSESVTSDTQDDAPKKSYASVAHALNFKQQPFQQRIVPAKPVQQPRAAVPHVSSPRPGSSTSVEKSNNYIVKGHSIFVANLPMNATAEQLREAFEKFGPIKSDGIQVRSYKQEKNCFGFVEFESADSMQSALKVASIMIGNRKAHIEEKKANNSNGGKNPPRRVGVRNDNFRNRGNFGGGRGSGRNVNENQGGFSDQVQGGAGRNREGNRRDYQNGVGRGPRQAGPQAQGWKN